MGYNSLPKIFDPLKVQFTRFKNRSFSKNHKSLDELQNNLEYYLVLKQFVDFIEDEVVKTEQSLIDQFSKSGHDIHFLEEYGFKIKLMKEHNNIFAVSTIQPSDAYEIRKRRINRKDK